MTNNPDNGHDVLNYLKEQLEEISSRLGFGNIEKKDLETLFLSAYQRESDSHEKLGLFVGSTPESKALVNFFMKKLLVSWEISGLNNLISALEHQKKGGRVVFMLNHTGVIDPPIINYLMDKFAASYLQSPKQKILMTWVAGMRVWDTIFLRIFSRCSDMVTIYQEKYLEEVRGTEEFMRRIGHNVGSLRWMRNNDQTTIWIFPEGGWHNDGRIYPGVASAINIPKIVSGNGMTDTLIVPCYLEGANKIMPPSGKSGDDFRRFLEVITFGSPILHFGKPQHWSDLLLKIPSGIEAEKTDQWLVDYVMRAIADLAPNEYARGPYAKHLR